MNPWAKALQDGCRSAIQLAKESRKQARIGRPQDRIFWREYAYRHLDRAQKYRRDLLREIKTYHQQEAAE